MRTQASVITVKVRISPPIGRLTGCTLVAARRAVITLCRAAKINYKLRRVPQGRVKVVRRKTERRRGKKKDIIAHERETLCICICARIGNIVVSSASWYIYRTERVKDFTHTHTHKLKHVHTVLQLHSVSCKLVSCIILSRSSETSMNNFAVVPADFTVHRAICTSAIQIKVLSSFFFYRKCS